MAFFLLEIGTEELPADFARLALPQLQRQVAADLDAARLPYRELDVTSTPRRLVVRVDGLPTRQEDSLEERKGPPAQQAFLDGVPTAAAQGFARNFGVPVESLLVRETSKGPFLFASTCLPGRSTEDVLAEAIPQWIWGLQGRRFMRWGGGEARFSRPVRWLVALLDTELIPLVLPGCTPPIRSGRLSRGHRLKPASISIADAATYGSTLAAADVIVDRSVRAAAVREQLEMAAARHDARLDLPQSLLEELVDLVESSQVIEGSMDPSFLSLPPEVISTVMRAHQRYVPLLRRDVVLDPLALSAESVLLPYFLVVSNANSAAATTVKLGNERVLRARLADAGFFLKADYAVPSIDRRESLARVTFAEGLGTLRDRSERLEWCTDVLLEMLQSPENVVDAARRAAHLCKHDLVSQMVGEFPELQGVMGAKYLMAEGEHKDVALAVLEHYQPRGAADPPPQSHAGAVVAIAERMELLLSIFSRGERPTGSSDPYGLRRAGNGIVQILWHHQWDLDLVSLSERGSERWVNLFSGGNAGKLNDDIQDHFYLRLKSLLEEENFDLDIIKSITESSDGVFQLRCLTSVCDSRSRCRLLQLLRNEGRLDRIKEVVQRSANLAGKVKFDQNTLSPHGFVNPEFFEKKSEWDLYTALINIYPIATLPKNDTALMNAIVDISEVVAAFFDGSESVMVMCEDEKLRINRLKLLSVLKNQASIVANFALLE